MPRSVLIVEDDPFSRDVFRSAVEHEGYEVTLAADGSEALRCTTEGSFDLVILDLGLPDMDGWQVVKHLRSSGGMDHTAVLVVTAAPPDEVLDLVEASGCQGYLLKPVRIQELAREITACIGGP